MSQNPVEPKFNANEPISNPADDAFSRRTLLVSVVGGVSAVAFAGRIAGELRSDNSVAAVPGAQTGFPGDSATGFGTPASIAGSPVASPAATPVPSSLGEIEIVRGESFAYSGKPIESNSLSLFVQGGRENLDFNPASFVQDFQIPGSYLDPLVRIDPVTMEPLPGLAESWEWGDGNQTITFKLRTGVRWHDGDALHARDVVFSCTVYRDDINSQVRNLFTPMEFAEDIDSETVKFTLSAPDGNWLLNASSQFIFQRKQYNGYWSDQPEGQRTLTGYDWSNSPPVGTGSWIIGRRRSAGIELHRNEDYWDSPPAFEELTLRFSADQDERIARWNEGESDILWPVSAADLGQLADTKARLFVSKGANVMFAAFNFENLARQSIPQMLTDTRIRQALTLAIDRDKYAGDQFAGFVQQFAAGTVAQPWANDPAVVSPHRDVVKARSLLKDAGVNDTNGDGLLEDPTGNPFTLTAIVRDDANPLLIGLLNGIVGDLAEIGAQLMVNVLTPDQFFDSWTNLRDYDFIAYSYALYPGFTDYDLYGSNWDIRINPQGWNPGGYHNEDVDSYIKKVLISPNLNSQRNLIDRLQQTVNEDLFGLWFGFPDDLVLVRPELQGFQPNKYLPTLSTRLLWRDETAPVPATPAPATPEAVT